MYGLGYAVRAGDSQFGSILESEESGSWKGAAVQRILESDSRAIDVVRCRYQVTTSEDTEGWKGA
jgi:hypothetical protein